MCDSSCWPEVGQKVKPLLSRSIWPVVNTCVDKLESRGRVVTRWPGSQEVGGSIPGCATKFVRCKNLAFNIGECVSRGSDTT